MSKKSQMEILEELADPQQIQLFRDPFGSAYIRLPDTDGRLKVFGLRQEDFRKFILRKSYQNFGFFPKPAEISRIIEGLEAFAATADILKTRNRIGGSESRILYDLADGNGTIVEVTADGFNLLASAPSEVFLTYPITAPQLHPAETPVPLTRIFEFVNITDPDQQLLYLVALVADYVPDIPKPILSICGNQGSAKSTLAVVTKRLVDPSNAEVGPFPATLANLAQYLGHNHLSAFDNLSQLSEDQSNLLCQSVTGGTYYKRKMHSDEGEICFSLRGCVILTSIVQVIEKPDLLDRSLILELQPIGADKRRDEATLIQRFEELRPGFLTAIFETLAKAMRIRHEVNPAEMPRLADFYKWGLAITQAMGIDPERFATAFAKNHEKANGKAIDAEPLAASMLDFLSRNPEWSGKISTLHGILQRTSAAKLLPKTPNHLSRKLRELELTLNREGITAQWSRNTDDNCSKITLRKIQR